jgi:hypothetical protein
MIIFPFRRKRLMLNTQGITREARCRKQEAESRKREARSRKREAGNLMLQASLIRRQISRTTHHASGIRYHASRITRKSPFTQPDPECIGYLVQSLAIEHALGRQ